jgi:hypothetical protein
MRNSVIPLQRKQNAVVMKLIALGQRRVGKPADIRRCACALQPITAEEAVVQKQPAECGHPETERVEARKSDVSNPQHQRNEVICEAHEDRHRHEENHRGAVHCEKSIEDFRGNDVQARAGELQPDQQNLDAARNQHRERIENIKDAEFFVIDRRDPVVQDFDDVSESVRARFLCGCVRQTAGKGHARFAHRLSFLPDRGVARCHKAGVISASPGKR